MYHAIVRAKVRHLWKRVTETGDYRLAVAQAAPDLRFRFAGDSALGADLQGRQAFEDWFARAAELLPGLRLRPTEIVVKGWPWNTTVIVRLTVDATLADGAQYTNEGVQWVRIRWGRMVDDYVLEDTARLEEGLRRQRTAVGG
ncbi:ketosteroid isomerase-like protein [Haloactinopolyspora alba]|uniref:Ketosteroid isomerase-like protein n=1 Tax=Haloactinopolyspora alba TaxID=648780 RepID=A0A2P8E515_9ACTN|nr:nuclear transport factor 2 family protein [Haloactinopolyspora alba]PSL04556.1 ketosteroid isomerase-like protein [Haloactinopolyspora alba]